MQLSTEIRCVPLAVIQEHTTFGVAKEPVHFRLWHIASFRCALKFDRYRDMADIDQAAPIRPDY
jgi:hypothetical protein